MNPHLKELLTPATLCLLLASCAQLGPPLPPSLELPTPSRGAGARPPSPPTAKAFATWVQLSSAAASNLKSPRAEIPQPPCRHPRSPPPQNADPRARNPALRAPHRRLTPTHSLRPCNNPTQPPKSPSPSRS